MKQIEFGRLTESDEFIAADDRAYIKISDGSALRLDMLNTHYETFDPDELVEVEEAQ